MERGGALLTIEGCLWERGQWRPVWTWQQCCHVCLSANFFSYTESQKSQVIRDTHSADVVNPEIFGAILLYIVDKYTCIFWTTLMWRFSITLSKNSSWIIFFTSHLWTAQSHGFIWDGRGQGVTKRCRPSLLTNRARVIRVQMRGERGVAGSQPMSTAVNITCHGAQINFGDLHPYLPYGRGQSIHCRLLKFTAGYVQRHSLKLNTPVLGKGGYCVVLETIYCTAGLWHSVRYGIRFRFYKITR
jgi:hypothetical protein